MIHKMFAKHHSSNNSNNNSGGGNVNAQNIAASFRMGIAGATIAPVTTPSQPQQLNSVPENNNDSNSMMLTEVKKRSGRKDFVRFESTDDTAMPIDDYDEARDRIHEDIRRWEIEFN